jgi:hypothetical protein
VGKVGWFNLEINSHFIPVTLLFTTVPTNVAINRLDQLQPKSLRRNTAARATLLSNHVGALTTRLLVREA